MDNVDALKDFKFKEGGGSDLFVTIKEGNPQKLRVLTLDPIVHVDKFANTRYAFVVWNYTANKAQILDKGTSIAKGLSDLHQDEDYEDLNKIDVKLSCTGEGMETRYSINVLPKTETLTAEQIKEAASIDLSKIIDNGVRMSEVNSGRPMPKAQVEPEIDNFPDDNFPNTPDPKEDEPINIDDIPF